MIDPHPSTGAIGSGASLSSRDASGVSWAAIIAGGVGAAALSLILLIAGTGLGLSSVSPWSNEGIDASTFGVSTIIWLTFTQLVSSGMGGYLAGRLRSKWREVHTDEVYFRDTAHGFLSWAVASLATAALLTSAVGSILGGGAKAAGMGLSSTTAITSAGVAGAAGSQANGTSGPSGYFLDSLFRKSATPPAGAASDAAASGPAPDAGAVNSAPSGTPPLGEVSRIFMNSIHSGALSAEDTAYVASLVSQRTNLSQQDAEKRVTDTYTRLQTALQSAEDKAKDAANKARKASAYAALWLFITLLIGAFAASLAATYGGRRRDL